MPIRINLIEDEELRKEIRLMIEGQLKRMIRDEVQKIIKDYMEQEIIKYLKKTVSLDKRFENQIQETINQVLNYNKYGGKETTHITKMCKQVISEKFSEQLEERLGKINLQDVVEEIVAKRLSLQVKSIMKEV